MKTSLTFFGRWSWVAMAVLAAGLCVAPAARATRMAPASPVYASPAYASIVWDAQAANGNAANAGANTATGAAAKAPEQSQGEQAGSDDPRNISTWLDATSRKLHMNRNLVWTIVMALNLLVLGWVLFRVLFRGKGFSIPGALRDRGEGIRTGLANAEQAWQQAQQRLKDVEARLANLGSELESLRGESSAEAEAEHNRLLGQAREQAARLSQTGQQEIAAASRQARQELKQFAAGLIVELSEQRLKQQVTAEVDRQLVRAALVGLDGARGKE